ncbi:MAG: hypothetical protein ACE5RJ_04105 [Nitrosopumilaceae archaeon]
MTKFKKKEDIPPELLREIIEDEIKMNNLRLANDSDREDNVGDLVKDISNMQVEPAKVEHKSNLKPLLIVSDKKLSSATEQVISKLGRVIEFDPDIFTNVDLEDLHVRMGYNVVVVINNCSQSREWLKVQLFNNVLFEVLVLYGFKKQKFISDIENIVKSANENKKVIKATHSCLQKLKAINPEDLFKKIQVLDQKIHKTVGKLGSVFPCLKSRAEKK